VRRSAEPLDLLPLPFNSADDLFFVLVNPKCEAPTRQMRAALPEQVPFRSMISNSVAGGSLVRAERRTQLLCGGITPNVSVSFVPYSGTGLIHEGCWTCLSPGAHQEPTRS
jgi:hypothetical protein